MAEMPTTVQIGPYRYTITTDADAVNRHKVEDGANRNSVGQLLEGTQKIWIDVSTGPDVTADTLLHEILHGCLYVVDAPAKMTHEQAIRSLCTVLLDTLRRNPSVVQFLMDGPS